MDTPVIGIVLVTHGRLADELKAVLEHVVGPQSEMATVCIGADDNMEERRAEILARTEEMDGGEGVVVLTDMFGGTPSNLAISIIDRPGVEVIAGVNLPMLIKLASVRGECKLAEAAIAARDAGRKYISIASELLGANGA
jgi:PTS system mannose-specific IIA component